MCNSLPAYGTIYNITIDGTSITLEQYVEQFPMTGTIDAQCSVSIVLEAPTYRKFDLTLDAAAMTGDGTLVDGDTSDCQSTYDLTMTLAAGHQ